MYQFYYSQDSLTGAKAQYEKNVFDEYQIEAVCPAMWEEHCLECSAPYCFKTCAQYSERADGRCKRFYNGIQIRADDRGCCGEAARIQYRKWANLMTIVFPAMLDIHQINSLNSKIVSQGKQLQKTVTGHLPVKAKWTTIRVAEYVRRQKLRKLSGLPNDPDAFVFHGYSFEKKPFNLIMEVFQGSTPLFRTALCMNPGENLIIIDSDRLSKDCWTANNLLKLYPENDLEAEIEILWCNFVKGARKIVEAPAEKVKCVVWDLDQTLWDGILIETDEPHRLQLNPHIREIIEELDHRGILQSVASKNDNENAWPILQGLGVAEYFLYPQIHWGAKSGSMESIAKSLNIGINSLALVDDSVFERNEVRACWPQVRTYDVSELPELLLKPELDVLITEESKDRRRMYMAEETRTRIQSENQIDPLEFLRQCNLRIRIFHPKSKDAVQRCYELISRTNQLNMSGNKYSVQEFSAILQMPERRCFAVSCEDNYGSYGIVGFGQYYIEAGKMVFTEYAMSCRVAGKFVESALFQTLLQREKSEYGEFEVKKTKKNGLLRRTLLLIGFQPQVDTEEKVKYIFTRELDNADIVSVED